MQKQIFLLLLAALLCGACLGSKAAALLGLINAARRDAGLAAVCASAALMGDAQALADNRAAGMAAGSTAQPYSASFEGFSDARGDDEAFVLGEMLADPQQGLIFMDGAAGAVGIGFAAGERDDSPYAYWVVLGGGAAGDCVAEAAGAAARERVAVRHTVSEAAPGGGGSETLETVERATAPPVRIDESGWPADASDYTSDDSSDDGSTSEDE